jgi:hypothetical protein
MTAKPTILLAAALTSAGLAAQQPLPSRISVDDLLQRVEAKYKDNERKYDGLAAKVEKAVREALQDATWPSGSGRGAPRPASEHPFVQLVDSLATAARAAANQKPDARVQKLLEEFPWPRELELQAGLAYGSDRPVPAHSSGFVHMGEAQRPFPGFPELAVNHYLFGLREIVGWQFGVKPGKRIAYQGRKPTDAAVAANALPGWEALRTMLLGSLPDVPLLAIPHLTHLIHARLAERRQQDGAKNRQDEFAALMDARWNGFTIDPPYHKGSLPIVAPLHALITDGNGFFDRFPASAHMRQVGDLPFVSVLLHQQYAKHFHGETVSVGDLINDRSNAEAMRALFRRDSSYLSRYRTLIDLIVRAILAPHLRYPGYLEFADYREGSMPTERATGAAFNMPRKHALVAWAASGKDPVALADFLYDRLLGKPENTFPNDVALPIALTLLVRAVEQELLGAIDQRIEAERAGTTASTAPGYALGDFEREFCPRAHYLSNTGESTSEFLIHSAHVFHARVVQVIQETAYATVIDEIGAKDLRGK